MTAKGGENKVTPLFRPEHRFWFFYFYLPGWRGDKTKDADVDISFWVTQDAYDKGLYVELFNVIEEWVKD